MGNIPLVEAVRHDKELVYMKLLERGTVNICGENSRTALIEAASVGNLALVKTLLGKGAKVDLSDRTGQTALMEASKLGHARIVKLLLENQCNVDHQDHEYDTALMKACIDDHADVIELLLAADAQLDIIGRKRKTALDHGGRYCGEDSIKRLLRHSTDPNIRDQHSGTVLISASNCKRPDIVSLILEDAELKPTSNFINLALSEACSDSNEKVVRLLIDHGANPNMNLKARRQFTLLSNAIYFGDDAAVLTLLEAGIDIETEDGDGKAPIHAAAARGTKTMVQSLIERGVSVNRRSSAGLFPLDYAMRREDKDTSIADLLRKQGAITEGKRLVQLMRDRSKRLD
ncbi:Ankyrin repeat domain-containing protein 50 [Fusarium oxysporum f. sp. rapae]|uniref:Ankyrin repeat domain-containing protein 50 n=1 Tax=Fusarium oxysporum f. sp. rapae TaxID=485398 RepID=A0A8J5PAN9_FUSOX|nr:Ankyrin repeat domain-containing protein 50 [Fusarium oxysporum f. sp. rapae]